MTWDKNWDLVWKRRIGALYPNEELVRFIARYYGGKKVGSFKALDLGCGAGNHCVFLAKEGFNTFGCDGSAVALETAKGRLAFEGLSAALVESDLTKLPYKSNSFDLVIDIASIQHNDFKSIYKIYGEIYRVLKSNGRLFSWVRSSKDYLYKHGNKVESHTYTNINEGDLTGAGVTHFFHPDEINFMLKYFNDVRFNMIKREVQPDCFVVHYAVEAVK